MTMSGSLSVHKVYCSNNLTSIIVSATLQEEILLKSACSATGITFDAYNITIHSCNSCLLLLCLRLFYILFGGGGLTFHPKS